MFSPLKVDAETVKEFKIGSEADVDDVVKLGYCRTQLEEIKKALWRERTDLVIAQFQAENAEDDNIKIQHQQKVAEKRMLIKQFVRSVEVFDAFVKELAPKVTD